MAAELRTPHNEHHVVAMFEMFDDLCEVSGDHLDGIGLGALELDEFPVGALLLPPGEPCVVREYYATPICGVHHDLVVVGALSATDTSIAGSRDIMAS